MVCAGIGKCVLMILNSLFLLISLVFMAAGCFLAFFPGQILKNIYDEAKEAADSNGINADLLPKEADDLEEVPFVYDVGIAFLALGIFLFFISMMGCCGACCTTCCRWMLIIFAIVLLVLMIVELVLGALFYVKDSSLHDTIRGNLKDRIKEDYENTGSDIFSLTMNTVQLFFECCGIEGGGDFQTTPDTCRKSATEYYQEGCYTKLTDIIEDNIVWAGLALAGLLALQLLEVIFAIVVFKDANKVGIL